MIALALLVLLGQAPSACMTADGGVCDSIGFQQNGPTTGGMLVQYAIDRGFILQGNCNDNDCADLIVNDNHYVPVGNAFELRFFGDAFWWVTRGGSIHGNYTANPADGALVNENQVFGSISVRASKGVVVTQSDWAGPYHGLHGALVVYTSHPLWSNALIEADNPNDLSADSAAVKKWFVYAQGGTGQYCNDESVGQAFGLKRAGFPHCGFYLADGDAGVEEVQGVGESTKQWACDLGCGFTCPGHGRDWVPDNPAMCLAPDGGTP